MATSAGRRESTRHDEGSGKRKQKRMRHTTTDATTHASSHGHTGAVIKLTHKGIGSLLHGAPVLQVLHIRRFLSDSSLQTVFGEHAINPVPRSAYDVVLSDGRVKRKCLLAPKLNSLIECGAVLKHTVVQIDSARVRYDETNLTSQGVCLVTEMSVVEHNVDKEIGHNTPIVFEEEDDSATEFTPSVGCRRTYVHLYRDDDILAEDQSWCIPLPDVSDSDLDKLHERWETILVDSYSAVDGNEDPDTWTPDSPLEHLGGIGPKFKEYNRNVRPPLLLAVASKEQLRWIEKQIQNQGVPAKSVLILTDGVTDVAAVLWYEASRSYYFNINVGDIVLVEDYNPRTARSIFFPHPQSMFKHCRVELAINSSHPAATFKAVRDLDMLEDVAAKFQDTAAEHIVPNLLSWRNRSTNFLDRRRLSALPDGTILNYTGMITRLGRECRQYESQSTHFYSYRWVALRDSSTNRSSFLKLYNSTNSAEFDGLLVGMILACTNVEIKSITESSHGSRNMYLMSTRMSQYQGWFVENLSDPSTRPFVKSKCMKDLSNWVESASAKNIARNGFLGGMELWLSSSLYDINEPKVWPMAELCNFIKNLRLRERRMASVRAKVVCVGLVDISSEVVEFIDVSLSRMQKRKLRAKALYVDGDSIEVGQGFKASNWNVDSLDLLPSSVELAFPSDIRGDSFKDRESWQFHFVGLNNDAGLIGHVPAAFTISSHIKTSPQEKWQGLLSVLPEEYRNTLKQDTEPTRGSIKAIVREITDKEFKANLDIYRPDSGLVEVTVHSLELPLMK